MGLLTWGRRLDDKVVRPAKPDHWSTDPLARIGMIVLIIFGGGGLFRLVFQDETNTPTAALGLFFGIGVIGLALLLTGAARNRR